MRTPTEADRVAAEGAELELVAGGTVTVRFGFSALRRCEKEFGTLQAAAQAINEAWTSSLLGWGSPGVDGLCRLLEATCPGLDVDELAEPLNVVTAAVVYAWTEAFPASDEVPTQGKDEGPAGSSRGGPSGDTPSVSSASPLNSSGS